MIYIFFILLLCISNCSKINIKPELDTIKKETDKRIGLDINWKKIAQTTTNKQLDLYLEEGLTEQDVIRITFENHPDLQILFEELGIAKSDLKEAGFYTNPRIDTVFGFPINNSEIRTAISVDASIKLSDFWQVPLRKQVAQDDLEIITIQILKKIIEIQASASKAFYDYWYANLLYDKVTQILNEVKKIRNRIYERHKFGYTNYLDIYYADILVNNWQLEQIDQKAKLDITLKNLKITLNILEDHNTSISLINSQTTLPSLPSVDSLEQFALEYRPEMQIAQLNIQRAQDKLDYEKSRVFKDVDLGISYDRDFDANTQGLGPSIGLNIPLFNTNQAQIARAQFEINRARAIEQSQRLLVIQEVNTIYTQLQALLEKITLYTQEILSTSQKAIKFAEHYYTSMQMNLITLLDAIHMLYEKEKNKIELELQAVHTFIDLEIAISNRINLLKRDN